MLEKLPEPEEESEAADAPALEVGEAEPRRSSQRKGKAKPEKEPGDEAAADS